MVRLVRQPHRIWSDQILAKAVATAATCPSPRCLVVGIRRRRREGRQGRRRWVRPATMRLQLWRRRRRSDNGAVRLELFCSVGLLRTSHAMRVAHGGRGPNRGGMMGSGLSNGGARPELAREGGEKWEVEDGGSGYFI